MFRVWCQKLSRRHRTDATLRVEVVFDPCGLIDPSTLVYDEAFVLVAGEAEKYHDRRKVLGDGAFEAMAEAVVTFRAALYFSLAT